MYSRQSLHNTSVLELALLERCWTGRSDVLGCSCNFAGDRRYRVANICWIALEARTLFMDSGPRIMGRVLVILGVCYVRIAKRLIARVIQRRDPTTRWTGAAGACSASSLVRRRVNEIAPPGQLKRSALVNYSP